MIFALILAISGDFNADLLLNKSDSRYLLRLSRELSLQIVKHNATHRPHGEIETRTWIDHIYVDNNDKILSYNNFPPKFRNGHNIIDVEITLFVPKPPQHTFSYRQFKNITPDDINRFLMNCDWTPIQNSELSTENLLDCLNSNCH